MTTLQMELALERTQFPCRLWILSPRVSWGMGLDECDLLALSRSGYAHSVEIKVSMGDLKKEFKKRKYDPQTGLYLPAHSQDRWFKARWFAVPNLLLEKALPLIPQNFGVFAVHESGMVDRAREAETNKNAEKWPDERAAALARNCMIKYWALLRKQKSVGNRI